VVIWSAEDGRQIHTMTGHTAKTWSVAFSADGRRLVSISDDGTARIWDVETGRQRDIRAIPKRAERWIGLSEDARWVAASSEDRVIVLDVDTGEPVVTLIGHRARSVAFSKDRTRIATGGEDGQVKLWDAETGLLAFTFRDQGPVEWTSSAAFSPDGRRIAVYAGTGEYIQTVRIYDSKMANDAPVADGFRPLFNGKDLSGWKTFPGQPNNWRIEGGRLIGGGPWSYLYTERGDYKDFHLVVEAKIKDDGNSGLIFRVPFTKEFVRAYEAEINSTDHADGQRTGSLRHLAPVNEVLVPPDTWFTYEVIAQDNHIRLKVNGKTTADYVDRKSSYVQGHIALQQLRVGSIVEFRKVEIKELPTVSEPKSGIASKPFFSGKDLTGWEGLQGYWKVKNGAIVGSCPPGQLAHTFLCSALNYRDFELRFRARRKDGVGNSGVQFRSRISDRSGFKVVGPQCKIVASSNRYFPSGSLVTEPMGDPAIAADRDRVAAVYKNKDFNDFMVRCVGKHVLIQLNGLTTVDADFPSLPDEGIIAWQIHRGNTPKEVEFKDISLVELGRTQPETGFDQGFESLFNRKDLAGWAVDSGTGNTWKVEDGELVVRGTGNYKALDAVAAVNDSVRAVDWTNGMTRTPLIYSVKGDGRPLGTSRPMQRPGESQPCAIDITGVRSLELRVFCEDAGAAHAVWVDPCVR
jgi:hypothetical protein